MPLQFRNYFSDVQTLVDATLQAADPATAVSNYLHTQNNTILIDGVPYDCGSENGRVYLISIGKAAIPMAQATLTILGDKIDAGICLTKASPNLQPPNFPAHIQFLTGEHPISGSKSVAATEQIAQLLKQTTPQDLLICLISGGSSALLTQPQLPLPQWQTLTQALLASGCSINEFNTVRRYFDAAKGGGLARWAFPAKVATLILSDVIGNDLKAIGSGPTVIIDEMVAEVTAVLQQYKIQEKLPPQTWHLLETHLQNKQPIQPQPSVQNKIIGDVKIAAQAMAQQAQTLGFTTQILTTHLAGEAKEAGRFAAAIAQDMKPAHCIILGGETTVTLQGNGIGGRNLEVALSAAINIENVPNCVIFTLATDGDDGPTQCAGAIVHGDTVQNGRIQNLHAPTHLNNNDSYTYFQQLPNHLIKTGPTGTNVNDLICILTYPS